MRPKETFLIDKIYLSLFISSLAYALALNTERGRRFAQERSAESVVLGNALILTALLALLPKMYWVRVCSLFVVAGSPMIGRSLYNRARADKRG